MSRTTLAVAIAAVGAFALLVAFGPAAVDAVVSATVFGF